MKGIVGNRVPPLGGAKEAKAIGLNKEKANALRRWSVSKAYSLRGNHPFGGWSLNLLREQIIVFLSMWTFVQ